MSCENLKTKEAEVLTETKSESKDTLYSEFEPVKIDSSNHRDYLTKDNHYQVSWNMLQDVIIELKYYPEFNSKGNFATFGNSPLFLENKKVEVEGYVIPLVVDSASSTIRYILSFYPNSSCFFCGGGGPETVIDLKLKPKLRKYREDEYLRFRGSLKLNSDNPWELNYILDQAEAQE